MAGTLTRLRRFLPRFGNGTSLDGKAMTHSSQGQWQFWPGSDTISTTDYRAAVGDGSGSSVVSAILSWIMRNFPQAPPALERRTGEQWQGVYPDPMIELLRTPNPFYGGRALWAATVMDFQFGEAFWLKIRNAFGAVVQLWWVPRALIIPRWPSDGSVFISHYEYRPAGQLVILAPEDVVHFRFGFDPNNIRRGFSQLAAVLREVYTDEQAATFTASLLRNLGIIGVVVAPESVEASHGGMPSPDDVKQMKIDLKTKFTGDQRGDPLVFSRPTKVEVLQYNLQGVDLGPVRDIAEERACAAVGIQPAVIGFGTGLQQTKVGATMSEVIKLAWTGSLIPTGQMLGDEVDRSLLPDFHANTSLFRTVFDYKLVPAMWEDESQKADRLRNLVGSGVISVAEGRRALGFAVATEHDIYYRPANVVAVQQPGDAAPVQPPAASAASLPGASNGNQGPDGQAGS